MWWDGSMAQPEHCSCVHRLGKLFIIECRVVGEKELYPMNLICFETWVLDFSYSASARRWRGEWCAFVNDLDGASESIYGAWFVDIVCIHWIIEQSRGTGTSSARRTTDIIRRTKSITLELTFCAALMLMLSTLHKAELHVCQETWAWKENKVKIVEELILGQCPGVIS